MKSLTQLITHKKMRRICMQAAILMMAVMTAVSCSEVQSDSADNGDGFIPVTFTMSTPAGEAVPYSSTRATHDEAEWTINKLALYVYAVDADGNGTFLRSYATDASGEQAINIISNGAGTYTFTLRAPVSDMNARRRFVFVANDALASEPGAGDPQTNLDDALATVTLENNATADALAADDKGIAMTGTAQSSGSDVVTITPGVKCEVHLKRIVARVDIQNNTPNLVIKSVVLENAAPKGYLFAHDPVKAADEGYITEGMNKSVSLGSSYGEQTALKKVFYLYERTNSEAGSAQVRINYMINNSNGSVTVPFKKTSDDMAYVDIERNTLYTIILGNGQPIVTNKVTFTLNVEDWNAVDLDESVDPDEDEQAKMNAALKVNMFTQFNAKDVNFEENKINSFFDKLTVSEEECPASSFYLGSDVIAKQNTIFTDIHGNKFRIPTGGEIALLVPYDSGVTKLGTPPDVVDGKTGVYYVFWNDNLSTNKTYVISETAKTTGWNEIVYLKNDADGYSDTSREGSETDGDYIVSGRSWLKFGDLVEILHCYTGEDPDGDDPQKYNFNMRPMYGLRFQGTSQYAAYRWESCSINGNPLERYVSIKIKALKKDDVTTTINDVAKETYWKSGYIEFKIPDSGYYKSSGTDSASDKLYECGTSANFWSTTKTKAVDGDGVLYFGSNTSDMCVFRQPVTSSYQPPIRFVKVEE